MAHPEEVLAAVLATWATARWRRGVDVPWERIEERLSADLTGTSEHRSKIRFPDEDGDRSATPRDWLEAMAAEGATHAGILELGPERGATVGGSRVEPHTLHAFAGTGGLVLAACAGKRRLEYRTRLWIPPPTTLTARDVLGFVERQPTSAALREALLWQDEHNVHVTDGKDWDRFVAALRPEHDEAVVRAMDMCAGNVRFRTESDGWFRLKREHKNPEHFWQTDFLRLPDGVGGLPPARLDERCERLHDALCEIEAFALEIGEADWGDRFRAALAELDAPEVDDLVRGLVDGSGMPLPAQRLVAAALAADVFGGMGSWNDLGRQEDDAYRRVSARLYGELKPSLVAAVNSVAEGA